MASKPTPAVRRAPRAKPKAVDGRQLSRELERIGRKHERPPVDDDEPRTGRGIVSMPGRRLADGSRKGARQARRVTLYLPLDVADELTDRARKRGLSLSDAAAETLAEAWAITLEAAV